MNSLFVALVPDLLTLYILMGFPKHIDKVSMGLPILYFKGSQVAVLQITMYFCP